MIPKCVIENLSMNKGTMYYHNSTNLYHVDYTTIAKEATKNISITDKSTFQCILKKNAKI